MIIIEKEPYIPIEFVAYQIVCYLDSLGKIFLQDYDYKFEQETLTVYIHDSKLETLIRLKYGYNQKT